MKRNKTFYLLILLAAGAALWTYQAGIAQVPGSPPLKVAVVDVTRVLSDCQENLDRQKRLDARQRLFDEKANQLKQEAERIREELETMLKPGRDEYKQRIQTFFDKVGQGEAYQKGQQRIFAVEMQAWVETLYAKFLEEVKSLAQTEGVDLVLNKDDIALKTTDLTELRAMVRGRKILYSADQIDWTARVIENMDRAYNQSKANGGN